jgi:hypothetical protein
MSVPPSNQDNARKVLSFFLSFFFFFAVLGFELRALCMLGRHTTIWATLLEMPRNEQLDYTDQYLVGGSQLHQS